MPRFFFKFLGIQGDRGKKTTYQLVSFIYGAVHTYEIKRNGVSWSAINQIVLVIPE